MTPLEYADKLRQAVLKIEQENAPLRIAATTMTALMATRIFQNGKDVNGGNIGNYSTKGLYLSKKQAQRLKMSGSSTGKGKTGRDTFESTGKKHKTTYFAGWKAVREAAGRQSGYVDLSFVGDMQSDFANTQLGQPAAAATAIRIDVNNYKNEWRSAENAKKAEGNEDHFGKKIFTPSTFEKEKFFGTAEFELNKILRG